MVEDAFCQHIHGSSFSLVNRMSWVQNKIVVEYPGRFSATHFDMKEMFISKLKNK